MVKRYAGSMWLKLMVLVAAMSLFSFRESWFAEPYVLEYPANFGRRFNIPTDNPTTHEGVYLGRLLFYEKKLSATNEVSCGSCHKQELAFSDNRIFSEGIHGHKTRRNSMGLINLLWVRNFFWDGRAAGLEQQAVFPLTDANEMGQPLFVSAEKLRNTKPYPELFFKAFGTGVTEDGIVKALAQFERTLISGNSRHDQFLQGKYTPTEAEKRGMELFQTQPRPASGIRGGDCTHCHGGPRMYKELFHNNGLDMVFTDLGRAEVTRDSTDMGRFRVATLRNIALTGPYMHDGRFNTLEEVLDHYSDHVKQSPTLSVFIGNDFNDITGTQLGLTKKEQSDIIAFLHMLTDSSFITNPAFSNPHLLK